MLLEEQGLASELVGLSRREALRRDRCGWGIGKVRELRHAEVALSGEAQSLGIEQLRNPFLSQPLQERWLARRVACLDNGAVEAHSLVEQRGTRDGLLDRPGVVAGDPR